MDGCGFDVADGGVSTCDLLMNGTRFEKASWRTSTGATAAYLGGPKTDAQARNNSRNDNGNVGL